MSKLQSDMGEAQECELNIIVLNKKETVSPQHEGLIDEPNKLQQRGLRWWMQIAFYVILILLGQSIAVLLGRLYYNKGGKSKWMATLVQVAGFPVLLPLYKLLPEESQNNVPKDQPPSVLKAASIYIFLGLFLAAMCMLYSIGMQYMPVSTFSLICASQLAFNAVFAFFINSQKFTPSIINSVVLLTISSTLLVFHADSSLPKGVTKRKYAFGLVCTIASAAGYGLSLSLTQFAFERVLKKASFKAILDMLVYPGLVASCATLVGLMVSGDWRTLRSEMNQYELGKSSYVMTLVWTALTWQLFSIGIVGLILKVSSLFSNVVATFGLPVVPVLAVIFFHDNMDGIKVVAMLLAIWGFVSYAYQQYCDHYIAGTVETASTNSSEAL